MSAESLKNSTIHVKYSPLTSFLEIVNCDGLHVYLAEGVSISTVSNSQEGSIFVKFHLKIRGNVAFLIDLFHISVRMLKFRLGRIC